MSQRFLEAIILAIGVLLLVSCSREESGAVFRVQCDCSVVQLISQPQDYTGKRVRVIGVLIPVSNMIGVGQLYLSKDDARFINDANSVVVDIRNSSNDDIVPLSAVTGKFVVVEGVFTVRNDQRTIESVDDLRVLPPLPLDNSRFEPVGD